MHVIGKDTPKDVLVKKFLVKINPSGWRTNRKEALTDLQSTIFNNKAGQIVFSEGNLVQLLLVGNKQYPKGLLKICGEHSVSNLVTPVLTRAAIIALRLLAALLDTTNYSGAVYFREQLKNLPPNSLGLPNFAHHLIRDNAQNESSADVFDPPMRVISAFLSSIPNLQLLSFIPDDWARYFYLRQAVGNFTQNPEDKFWEETVLCTNFSHSLVHEFLTTSKHRMGREVWIKNVNTYLVKCKPILKNETLDALLVGLPKTAKGLIRMCNHKKSYSAAAKDLLAQILDDHYYPDSGRIADYLLGRKDLLTLLNYPAIFEKFQSIPADRKIYNTLTSRARVGEVKDVLLLLHDDESTRGETPGLKRDTSMESLRKCYEKMHRRSINCSSTDISWGDYSSQGSFPSVLSVLDEPFHSPMCSPITSPTTPTPAPIYAHTPTNFPYAVSPVADPEPQSSSSSSSPVSSARTSEEYAETVFTPAQAATTLLRSPSMEHSKESESVIAALEQFFTEHSVKFSRIEYRRLLIFLMSLVTKPNEKFADVDAMFAELGLDRNPQVEISASYLFEVLEDLNANFTEELCNMWAGCIMREIATTERSLDP